MYNPPSWVRFSSTIFILVPESFLTGSVLSCSYQEWRKAVEGIHDPAPQPENRNRDLDPGYEEDPDIFVELEDGIFYQMSYDDTYVPIIADYPDLLPASCVSNPKTPYPKEFSHSSLPTALCYA